MRGNKYIRHFVDKTKSPPECLCGNYVMGDSKTTVPDSKVRPVTCSGCQELLKAQKESKQQASDSDNGRFE